MGKFKIDQTLVRKRADFFLAEAGQQNSQTPFSDYAFVLSERDAGVLAEAYFLVNEAYKERRQHSGHRTQPPKIAAITSLVATTLNPVRPKSPPASPNIYTGYANPMFAMRAACSIVEHPFHTRPWFQRMWFYDSLRNNPLESLNDYLERMRNNEREIGDEFDITLTPRDMKRIESQIALFTVLQDLKIYKEEE